MAERTIRCTVIDQRGIESHLELPRETVRALLAVPTPQFFIELPPGPGRGGMWKEYLHSSQVARLLIHDSLE